MGEREGFNPEEEALRTKLVGELQKRIEANEPDLIRDEGLVVHLEDLDLGAPIENTLAESAATELRTAGYEVEFDYEQPKSGPNVLSAKYTIHKRL